MIIGILSAVLLLAVVLFLPLPAGNVFLRNSFIALKAGFFLITVFVFLVDSENQEIMFMLLIASMALVLGRYFSQEVSAK